MCLCIQFVKEKLLSQPMKHKVSYYKSLKCVRCFCSVLFSKKEKYNHTCATSAHRNGYKKL